MYRLIYCRLFRLDIMSVKVNRPKQFLRPIMIFTGIKFAVFNIPLIIVDFVGIAQLQWGNQCYMTMLESLTLCFTTMILLIWEYFHIEQLILKEGSALKLDKMELL